MAAKNTVLTLYRGIADLRTFPIAAAADVSKVRGSCVIRKVLLDEPLDHAIEVRIASTKASCEPVPTAFGNPLTVSYHLELTGLTRRNDGLNV
jgi:hypothetical protein